MTLTLSRQGVAEATIILIIGTMLMRILGFVREMAIAYKFGASAETDAYLVAFIIPGALATMVGGAITVAFIPVFTEYRIKEGEVEAWRFASSVINIILIILVIGSIISSLGASILVPVIAPGLADQTKEIAIHLMKIMSPLVISSGLIGLTTAIINSYQHFVLPAFAGLLYNICIISSVLLLANRFGITGLALGTVIGSLFHLLAQSTVFIKEKRYYVPSIDLNHPGVKKTVQLIVPFLIGSAAGQLNLMVDRILASGLTEGSISALNFSSRVMNLPLGIFGAAVGTAIFPTLSQQIARGKLNSLRETFSWGLRTVWFVTIPASVGLIVLREPLIRLLFERGAFDQTATQMTAAALLYYSLGIFAHAGLFVITRTYFSMQDTITPVKIGVVGVVINIILNLILVRFLAHSGLALATSIAASGNLVLLIIYLRKKLGYLDGKRILYATIKIISASLMMGFACQLALNLSYHYLGESTTLKYQALQVGGIALIGIFTYFIAAALLRMEELAKVGELKYFQKLGLGRNIRKLK